MKTFLSAILAACLLPLAAFAADVTLYFYPSKTAAKAPFTLDENTPAVRDAASVPNAPAGWFTFKWRALYTGYSPAANAEKDLTLKPRSPIYAAPAADSQILGLVPDTAQVAVAQIENDWATVRFTATIPLYFYREPAPVAKAVPMATGSASSDDARTISTQTRFYKGIMRKLGKFPILFEKPPYPYELVSLDGHIVGLLDFKDVISPIPPADYLDKQVNVLGVPEYIDRYPKCLIRVKIIQLSEPNAP